jgi:hypothetical protein
MIYEEMKQLLDNNILLFLNNLSIECSIPQDVLLQKWELFNTKPVLSKESIATELPIVAEKKVPKKSGYQNFFSKKRLELKTANPSITFPELSKIISVEWGKLNMTEKNKYLIETPVSASHSFTIEELNKKKMADLKDLCEKCGIKKSGNKTELIKNLLGKNQNNAKEVPKTKITVEVDKVDHSLDLYVSSKTEKRSDFETTGASNEEEEFEFDNLSDKFAETDSEATLEDDDEDGNDEDDPFDDE